MNCIKINFRLLHQSGNFLLTIINLFYFIFFCSVKRFFPDFFPSCYTEKRLNLRRLYAEIERKNNDDLLGEEEKNNSWGFWTSDSLSKFSQTGASGLGNLTKMFSVYLNTTSETENSETDAKEKK